MTNGKCSLKIFPIVFIQVPFLFLIVLIYALGLTILRRTTQSASIAASQLMDNGFTLTGVYSGVIALGMIQIILAISLIFFTVIDTRFGQSWLLVLFLGLTTLLFVAPSEVIFFKFCTCFNFFNNDIVVARSSLVIVLGFLLLLVPLLCLFYVKFDDGTIKCDAKLLTIPVLLIPTLAIIGMNGALIYQLNAPLNQDIQPSNINMGFFDETEFSEIQNGSFTRDSMFDQRFVGTLSQIIESTDKKFAYKYDYI